MECAKFQLWTLNQIATNIGGFASRLGGLAILTSAAAVAAETDTPLTRPIFSLPIQKMRLFLISLINWPAVAAALHHHYYLIQKSEYFGKLFIARERENAADDSSDLCFSGNSVLFALKKNSNWNKDGMIILATTWRPQTMCCLDQRTSIHWIIILLWLTHQKQRSTITFWFLRRLNKQQTDACLLSLSYQYGGDTQY